MLIIWLSCPFFWQVKPLVCIVDKSVTLTLVRNVLFPQKGAPLQSSITTRHRVLARDSIHNLFSDKCSVQQECKSILVICISLMGTVFGRCASMGNENVEPLHVYFLFVSLLWGSLHIVACNSLINTNVQRFFYYQEDAQVELIKIYHYWNWWTNEQICLNLFFLYA